MVWFKSSWVNFWARYKWQTIGPTFGLVFTLLGSLHMKAQYSFKGPNFFNSANLVSQAKKFDKGLTIALLGPLVWLNFVLLVYFC